MLFWFAGLSFVLVALVFDSPALDYRLVMAGATLPSLERLLGHPFVGHTLVGSVGALFVVMLVGRGKRLRQRQWLGLPIGLFMHLVLDGAWLDEKLFWWPFFGWSDLTAASVPEASWGPGVILAEALGLAALWWAWRRFDLADPARRSNFVRTGRLGRIDRSAAT